MWERANLKEIAKQRFYNNYWSSVVVAIILAFSIGTFSLPSMKINLPINGTTSNDSYFDNSYDNYSSDFTGSLYRNPSLTFREMLHSYRTLFTSPVFLSIFLSIISVAFFISLLLSIFLLNPLIVGCRHWFIQSRTINNYAIGNVGITFKKGYWNVIKTMFFKQLFTFLWSLLFVIPGIIKKYEYRMIPYLLAENPNMDMDEAFARSRDMMYGQKMDTFILDLSFIGWFMLSYLTLGLVGIFYVSPYYAYTDMELYVTLCCNSTYRGHGNHSSYTQQNLHTPDNNHDTYDYNNFNNLDDEI